ncbi:protein of unknown function DUF177 [Gemmatirosa kalamazoonensis]|uniref:DUF177 domain-containing protein n=1 Tax=Gemmatirosa kalamazoonensis TaxID=861299 RepID=W0RK53_9BACT|nr:DUF177 domain-containing protein [Gemmatirosa kalamazoonensis]AHG90812.1 protein of unknown function DUF177 [Gemmatirosa kalamazoonensis]
MLSFDIGALQSHAAAVDGELTPDDEIWQEGDRRPVRPIHVVGRLSAAGPGRYYFSGRVEGDVATECRRCLADVSEHIAADSHMIFAESELDDPDDASDVFVLAPGARSLDLRPAVREEWLLAVPAFSLCREDCKGLCPRCGADLNEGPCDCPPTTDSRWDALNAAKAARSDTD